MEEEQAMAKISKERRQIIENLKNTLLNANCKPRSLEVGSGGGWFEMNLGLGDKYTVWE